VNGRRPVEFLGRCGGNVPSHHEVMAFVHSLARQNLREVVREKEEMAHA
jgi:hypothetical protein